MARLILGIRGATTADSTPECTLAARIRRSLHELIRHRCGLPPLAGRPAPLGRPRRLRRMELVHPARPLCASLLGAIQLFKLIVWRLDLPPVLAVALIPTIALMSIDLIVFPGVEIWPSSCRPLRRRHGTRPRCSSRIERNWMTTGNCGTLPAVVDTSTCVSSKPHPTQKSQWLCFAKILYALKIARFPVATDVPSGLSLHPSSAKILSRGELNPRAVYLSI